MLAALLSALPLAAHEGLRGAVFGILQILGPWAVYRAFSELRHPYFRRLPQNAIMLGLFVGFVLVVVMGFSSVRLSLAYATLTQGISWGSNPALFAHMVLVVGSLIALLSSGGWLRYATLSLAGLGILAAGSRDAVFGLLVVLAFLLVRAAFRRAFLESGALALLAATLATAILFGPGIGLGTIGYLIVPSSVTPATNLVRGSEIPSGDWWDSREVTVHTGSTRLDGIPMTVYRVTKRGAENWLRLQQLIPLRSQATYTVSAWILDQGPAQAGLQGWGQLRDGTVFALTTRLVDHSLAASLRGPGTLDDYGVAQVAGAWKRVYATFTYRGSNSPLDWSVGLAPDARDYAASTATFAGFQLERGRLTPYQPGEATRGLAFTTGRLALWRIALKASGQHPWLGWGAGAFPAAYMRAEPSTLGIDGDVPAHAHNLFLEVLFERGVVGLLGLLVLLYALVHRSVRLRDLGLIAVFAAVLLANCFDYTLFFGGVIYPLAAVAGWRSEQASAERVAADSLSRQVLVRLVLMGTDLALTWVAFRLALWSLPLLGLAIDRTATGTVDLARYALFLWPAMAWREGLYPGYGHTEPDELRRQVWSATYAGITLLAASVVFGGDLGLAPATVISTTLVTFVLLPIGRGGAKRLLRALGLWGRPVVILGEGRVTRHLARSLRFRSLDGLRPIAIFGDRGASDESTEEGPVPYLGPLSAANVFARREGVHHAIVAVDLAGHPLHLPKLDPSEDAFTIVQYVPELPGLPVLGVRASSLDNILALEVRNELASPVNRFAKRALDVTATVVGGVLISPILLGLAAAVALDSRGPVFFGHTRIGRNGRKIRVWKFRTMVRDAQEALERHLQENPELRAEWEATHKLKNDPRVTRVGRTLRRYSLDELPQLWNVLKGEMSLVGPRPIVDAEVPKYRDAFDLYTMVRPGMTGYWQISGRSDTDYDQRVELDGFYVRNWSVWLDIVVLIKTVSAVLKRDGAY